MQRIFPARKIRSPRMPMANAVLAAAGLLVAGSASATEGAMGRPVTGMQVTSYVGLIPPDPGMQWSLGFIHYDGSIGADRQVPIAGQLSFGLEADVNIYTATGIYIWPTRQGRWNYASMLTVPYIQVDVTATLALGGSIGQRKDSASNPFDLYFAPIIASYHVSEVEHWSLGAYIYAPTASYDPERLANPGLNVWTVSPGVGYTHLFQKGTLEFSALAALDIYSKNDDTDYQNGAVFRLDALLLKRAANGWGFGAAAGWIEQVEDDSGPTADALNGFRGHSLGIGPVVSYGRKWESGSHVEFQFRYISEFSVKNRFEGEPLSITASFGF